MVTTPFDTTHRTRAPLAPCWAGFSAAASRKTAVPSALVKATHHGSSLMIGTDVNVWPLSPEGWLSG
jgi:hypothetical protein